MSMNPHQELFDRQKAYFWQHLKGSSARDRIRKLKRMKKWIFAHQEDIRRTVYADFKKPMHEADATEILPLIGEIKDATAHLREWMRPKRVSTPMSLIGTRTQITYEPKGQSLILAPWNYPFMLTIGPLISAVAAGCTSIIKPSEFSPHTTALMVKMIDDLFPQDEVAMVEGDHVVAQELTALPFDHVFFTGSPQVGRKVMHAAAEHLTSVTLELGGRNPVIVDDTANLNDTARKLIWGKFLNTGQSCMSPNYVLVHEKIHDKLLAALQKQFSKAYGPQAADMQQSPDFGRLISAGHHQRVSNLVTAATTAGAKVLVGGEANPADNYLAPTILHEVQLGNPVLEEEIFGPILPILRYQNLNEALDLIRQIEKPLGLYIFSRSQRNINRVIAETSSGNLIVNDTTVAFGHPGIPFGGVNHSGIGKAHGHAGFLAFTNEKPVMRQSILLPSTLLAQAPYTKFKNRVLNLVMRWF
ncbi:MAG: aldehyde dehydrogenase family protein [Bacteroidota bacterium]